MKAEQKKFRLFLFDEPRGSGAVESSYQVMPEGVPFKGCFLVLNPRMIGEIMAYVQAKS